MAVGVLSDGSQQMALSQRGGSDISLSRSGPVATTPHAVTTTTTGTLVSASQPLPTTSASISDNSTGCETTALPLMTSEGTQTSRTATTVHSSSSKTSSSSSVPSEEPSSSSKRSLSDSSVPLGPGKAHYVASPKKRTSSYSVTTRTRAQTKFEYVSAV